MMSPKSILLMNRKNLEWLNEKIIPYMSNKYNTKLYYMSIETYVIILQVVTRIGTQ